jgi:hypothetical protein
MGGTTKIDMLLIFLADMRKEQKDDHEALSKKVDAALLQLSGHETRIVVVEGRQKTARWFGGALVVGFITFLFDLVTEHLPKMLHWGKP